MPRSSVFEPKRHRPRRSPNQPERRRLTGYGAGDVLEMTFDDRREFPLILDDQHCVVHDEISNKLIGYTETRRRTVEQARPAQDVSELSRPLT